MAKTPTSAAQPKAKAAPAAAKRAAASPKATTATKKPAAAKAKASAAETPKAQRPIRDQIHATRDTIRDEAQRKAGEIGDEMNRIYAQASERARDMANTGKARAATGLESLARVITDSAPQVDDTLGKQFGDFARSAAGTVDEWASKLDQKDIDELVASTRDFVKKSPAVAIGSAAVVGFMLARMIRGNRGA